MAQIFQLACSVAFPSCRYIPLRLGSKEDGGPSIRTGTIKFRHNNRQQDREESGAAGLGRHFPFLGTAVHNKRNRTQPYAESSSPWQHGSFWRDGLSLVRSGGPTHSTPGSPRMDRHAAAPASFTMSLAVPNANTAKCHIYRCVQL